MLRLFIFILMCSPFISIASDPLPNLEIPAANSKPKKPPFSLSFNPKSVSAELALAKAMQSRSPVSGTNSPETGSLRRPNSQLTYESGVVTPTNAHDSFSANVTPMPPLQPSKQDDNSEENSTLGLLFS